MVDLNSSLCTSNLPFYNSNIIPELILFFILIHIIFLILGWLIVGKSKNLLKVVGISVFANGIVLLIFIYLPNTIWLFLSQIGVIK